MAATEIQRSVNGVAWRRWGAADAPKALVLIHGLASNGTRWRELAENIGLGPDWRVLAPDLRGHGRSARHGRIDSKVWMDDLEAMLDAEGIERAFIGGHCLGANLALRFAESRPQRCAGLVLVEPMLPEARTGRTRRWARFRFVLVVIAWLARIANALGIRRREFPELDLGELDRQTRSRMAAEGSEEAMLRRYAAPTSDLCLMPLAAYCQALNETLKPLPPLSRIRAPALALLSAGGLFGDAEITRASLQAMPRVRVVNLPARHWIPTEQPEALRAEVRAFIENPVP